MAKYTTKNADLASVTWDTSGAGTDLDPYRMNQTSVETRLGATDETAAASDSATSGLNGLFKRLLARITTLIGLLPGSLGANGGVKVDAAGSSLPVSGTVTANAGTNLNTSALALENGGNLQTAATSLAVIDDWDESDRAKVNPIAGQAGVAGGSGTTGSNTQRVVHATDDPLVSAVGATSETAPASDTATSGLNGRLQRIAQRLTSLIGLLPGTLSSGGGVKAGLVDAIPAGTNNIGDVDVVTLPGYTPHKLISGASTNSTSLLSSPGTTGFIYAVNANASVRFLKLYNKTTSPTVGTDTPVLTLPIPPSYSGFLLQKEVAFTTGIAYAITTGSADSDTGAVGAGDVIVNIGYKS